MKIKVEEGAYYPVRAYPEDAGLDIRTFESGTVPPHGFKTFRTGIHAQIPPGTAGILMPKSGLYTKHGITSFGVIDEGYGGEIMVALCNNSDLPYQIDMGQKITQLLIVPVLHEPVEIVQEIESGKRGENGFGSTGK